MRKEDYIKRYGEAAWNNYLEYSRKKYQEKKTYYKEKFKQWRLENKTYKEEYNKTHKIENTQYAKKYHNSNRLNGSTAFCRKNYELIENYELAKTDNFDKTKWHLHHRLENYWSVATLKRKGLYYGLNPEALIWLPANEHFNDRNKKNSKWHQRKLEHD